MGQQSQVEIADADAHKEDNQQSEESVSASDSEEEKVQEQFAAGGVVERGNEQPHQPEQAQPPPVVAQAL